MVERSAQIELSWNVMCHKSVVISGTPNYSRGTVSADTDSNVHPRNPQHTWEANGIGRRTRRSDIVSTWRGAAEEHSDQLCFTDWQRQRASWQSHAVCVPTIPCRRVVHGKWGWSVLRKSILMDNIAYRINS